MKYIDRSTEQVPAILQGQAVPANVDGIDDDIWGHDNVRDALKRLQKGICCYCEANFSTTSYGEVEHYRPKKAYQQMAGDSLHRPGYYWLAYKWENLTYACQVCNRKYKRNYFPLKDNAKRFDPETRDISQEEPLLINPYEELHPERHIAFVDEIEKGITLEGATSIEYYGLYRSELREARLKILNTIKALDNIVTLTSDPVEKQRNFDITKALVQEKLNDGEHTLMIKSNFPNYL